VRRLLADANVTGYVEQPARLLLALSGAFVAAGLPAPRFLDVPILPP
jgi:hypothetical protein